MEKELKQIKIGNYYVILLPKLLSPLELNRKERSDRKRLFKLIETQNQIVNEEIEELKKKHADLDEKREKKVSSQVGKQINYEITGENVKNFNEDYIKYMNEKFSLDLLPNDMEVMERVVEILKNDPNVKINAQDERNIEMFELLLENLKNEKVDNAKQEKGKK